MCNNNSCLYDCTVMLFACRIPLDPELQVDMLGSVYVDTVDSVSNKYAMSHCKRLHTIFYCDHVQVFPLMKLNFGK